MNGRYGRDHKRFCRMVRVKPAWFALSATVYALTGRPTLAQVGSSTEQPVTRSRSTTAPPNDPVVRWPSGGGDTPAVDAARKDACKTTSTPDPVLGCAPRSEGSQPMSIPEPYPALFRWFGLGLNAGANGLFPAWGGGVTITGSAGLSGLVGTWYYEGQHRVTAAQVDADIAYSLFEPRGSFWMVSIGPAYQGWDYVFPVIKAQAFVARSIEHPAHPIDSVGVGLSLAFDVIVFGQPSRPPKTDLNSAKPVFLFNGGSTSGAGR